MAFSGPQISPGPASRTTTQSKPLPQHQVQQPFYRATPPAGSRRTPPRPNRPYLSPTHSALRLHAVILSSKPSTDSAVALAVPYPCLLAFLFVIPEGDLLLLLLLPPPLPLILPLRRPALAPAPAFALAVAALLALAVALAVAFALPLPLLCPCLCPCCCPCFCPCICPCL